MNPVVSWGSLIFFYTFATGVVATGLGMAGLGGLLAAKGGSPFYLVSGLILLASGVQLFRRRMSAFHLAALNFVATWAWAIWEVGLDGWALIPRVNIISAMLLFYAAPPVYRRLQPQGAMGRFGSIQRAYPLGVLVVVAVVAGIVAAKAASSLSATASPLIAERAAAKGGAREDWRSVGQDAGGAKFSTLAQIDRDNAARLQRVWDHVEPAPAASENAPPRREQAAPLKVGDKLFVCMGDNTVLALDAEDGHLLWRHDPRVNLQGVLTAMCRGVAYYEDPAPAQPSAPCAKRVLFGTLDARLIALDAATGKRCADFGQNGEVSLKEGIGPFTPGQYYSTSPPVIARGLAILGALVQDGESTNEPSGVVRAFDARSGKLAWAWDLGRPSSTGAPAAPETYTRGTPNAWSLFSADDELGLVYIPTGNATPDFVGSYRKPLWEKFSSSVVALDVATGQVRWSYQFVHHDLWDHDTAAQPILFDMPTARGPVPALLQATKAGQLFIFDRRDGTPLAKIAEKPSPQTDVEGEWTAKTQPFAVGMPSVGGPDLREADMWGLTPFDQMLCRLKFLRLRYEGVFTPPSLRGSIIYPSQIGGVDWGGASVDLGRGLLVVPSGRMATMVALVPRAEADKGRPLAYPQAGTPYAAAAGPLMTQLFVPCQRPPYSTFTAIDLRTRKVAWTRAIGTAEDQGPFGIPSHLPFTIGAPPVVGGPITTAGDVIFMGAVGDRRLRAIDMLTGRELWSDKLPEGGQATPITYRAPRSGRQMVVMVSGGYAAMRGGARVPTHVVAYAIP